MKLIQIWVAREAWQRLASLKKSPKLAYRLMRYERRLSEELAVIDAKKNELIEAIAPETKTVNANTLEMAQFIEAFGPFLDADAELQPIDMTLDVLIDAIDAEQGNVLSDSDCAALEPFFKEVVESDKKYEGNITEFPKQAEG